MSEEFERESMEFDVVIVGGGPAGLAAAIRLLQLDDSLSVGTRPLEILLHSPPPNQVCRILRETRRVEASLNTGMLASTRSTKR